MKGIMFDIGFKVILWLCLSSQFVSARPKDANDTLATTTTTTTAKSVDLSSSETFENSVRVLRPGESISRSVSYSQSSPKYAQQNPGHDKGRYEEQTVQYQKDPGSREEVYKGHEDDSYGHHEQQQQQQLRHPLPEDYSHSYEQPYHQQQHYGKEDHSYEQAPEQVPEQRNHYQHLDHSVKGQAPYAPQEYAKENSYEAAKEVKGYEAGRPPFHYAYEVTDHQKQDSYGPVAAPDNAGKSGYGPGDTDSYPPKAQYQPEYYPSPVATRFVLKDVPKQEDYRSDGQQENYFQAVPKEAGYAHKEPGYLQVSPPSEHSYSKQAGYSPRKPETGFVPMLPKEKTTPSLEDGKVYIKHLGHKTPGTNRYVHKENQGFLLLPVVQQKMEEKLRQLKGLAYNHQEYAQSYQVDKQLSHIPRPVIEKQTYVQPKVVQYIHQGPSYSLDHHVSEKPEIKTIVSQGRHAGIGPVLKPSSLYANSQYGSPEVHLHSADEASHAGRATYLPQTVADYAVPDLKTYSSESLQYNGPHGATSGLSGSLKYEPASVHGRSHGYISPYDVTSAHKSVPDKIDELRSAAHTSLPHSYPRIVDSVANKGDKNHPLKSTVFSPHYRSVDARLAAAYEHPTLDAGKPLALYLQKPKEHEVITFRPSRYSSEGRISAKSLVEGFGLHDYKSLLSKPTHDSGAASLYYDLHRFPDAYHGHGYPRFDYRRSGVVAKKPSL